MDIGLINAQYVNPALNPFSSGSGSPATGGIPADHGFQDLLKRLDYAGTRQGGTVYLDKNDDIDRNSELFEVCVELETLLIKNLLNGMRSTVQKSGFIDTGFAGEVYEDMLYDEYAKSYARNAGFGFAEMAYRELVLYA